MRSFAFLRAHCQSGLLAALMALALGALSGPASAAPMYDFEGLSLGTLHGQDGWTDFFLDATNHTVTSVSPSHLGGPTKVVTGFDQSSRNNDGNFSYLPYSATDTAAEIRFDFNSNGPGDTGTFALGRDLGTIDGTRHTRLGPQFGMDGGSFLIRGANEGAITTAALAGTDSSSDWYRIKLVVNFTANSGNGSGTLQVRNLTDSEIGFRTILSGINLQILNMEAASEDPATWNSLYLRSSTTTNLFDNLLPSTLAEAPPAVVPEPSTWVLLGVAAVSLAWRVSRRRAG